VPEKIRTTRHETVLGRPPEEVFELVADAGQWPQVFGPTVHAEVTDEGVEGGEQLLRIWATANGEVRNWSSRRTLDRAARHIAFRQVVTSPPVAAMRGEWHIEATPHGGSRVVLTHEFSAVDDDEQAADWIEQAVERNSTAELAALGRAVATGPGGESLRMSFSDSVQAGGSADDVFDFLARADQWPSRLPHVARLELTEDDGVQRMEMDTRTPDGQVHTSRSVRVLMPQRRTIVYKQTAPPPGLAAHTGRWVVEPHEDGVRITSWHTVTLDLDEARRLLGADLTIDVARQRVRRVLGANSTTTLEHAKEHAELRHATAGPR
jgi:aromatase